ncbi:major facilitator superfamily domain-containing protein [Zychaea mexicana]|uniref:major facilitator superfamily domain-containing protein n=1 Tax=Zychaea mexicana TaxID=64656 RepID=UPI0022FE5DD9|nr:major facilitator superfamily domain-containing protein [Zychaea mexicana]KAI9497523.1 major facilitator superfamily domain-containing protein [Zychaea mexicana]
MAITRYETSEKEEVYYTEDVQHSSSASSTEAKKDAGIVDIHDITATKSYEGTPEERAYVRKVNRFIFPLMGLIIFVQFCDKASLSVAPILGLNQDLGLTGTEFSLLGSMFYLGHLVYQLPNQFILQRVPLAKYLGILLVVWGIVMGASGACQTFSQLAACRFLLGFFEAAAMPTLYLITATLYRRTEQPMLFGYITLCNGLGAAIGSAISFGFAHMNHARGIENWRWNHIVFGSLTVLLGIVTWFLLVDKPDHHLLRLTETDRLVAKDRTKDNAVVKNREYKYDQIWEAVKELRFWLIMVAGLTISLQNGGMLVFSTTFVLGLGFTGEESLLLQIPSGLASALGVLIAVVLAHKTRQIIWSSMFMLVIGMIGLIILCAIPEGEVKLLGFYLSWAGTGSYALVVTLIGNNVKGYTKKIFYNSCIMVAYTVGNFVGPLMMVDHQAPRYLGGVGGFLGGFFVAFCCLFGVRIISSRVNRERLANKTGEETDVYLDLTDKQDKNFISRL